jgi:hypothetical protein
MRVGVIVPRARRRSALALALGEVLVPVVDEVLVLQSVVLRRAMIPKFSSEAAAKPPDEP